MLEVAAPPVLQNRPISVLSKTLITGLWLEMQAAGTRQVFPLLLQAAKMVQTDKRAAMVACLEEPAAHVVVVVSVV